MSQPKKVNRKSEQDSSVEDLHNTAMKKFKCRFCGNSFKLILCPNQPECSTHLQQPFKCAICNIGFCYEKNTTQYLRKKHVTSPSPADIPVKDLNQQDCDSLQPPTLNTDQLHEDSKPTSPPLSFQCFHCQALFPNQSQLWSHAMSHIGSNVLKFCKICDKIYTIFSLKRHMRADHNIEYESEDVCSDVPVMDQQKRGVRRKKAKSHHSYDVTGEHHQVNDVTATIATNKYDVTESTTPPSGYTLATVPSCDVTTTAMSPQYYVITNPRSDVTNTAMSPQHYVIPSSNGDVTNTAMSPQHYVIPSPNVDVTNTAMSLQQYVIPSSNGDVTNTAMSPQNYVIPSSNGDVTNTAMSPQYYVISNPKSDVKTTVMASQYYVANITSATTPLNYNLSQPNYQFLSVTSSTFQSQNQIYSYQPQTVIPNLTTNQFYTLNTGTDSSLQNPLLKITF